MPERLFDHEPPPAGALPKLSATETMNRRCILARLGGEIKEHIPASVTGGLDVRQFRPQTLVRRVVADVPWRIVQISRKRIPHFGRELCIFGEALDGVAHFV